jgi:hypothetical protein
MIWMLIQYCLDVAVLDARDLAHDTLRTPQQGRVLCLR